VLPGPSALEDDKDDQVDKGDQMNSNSGSCQGNARPWRAAGMVTALAVTALVAAACGGGGSHGSGSGSSSDQNVGAQMNAYASCMRSHGDPSFSFSRQTGTSSPPGDGAIVDVNGHVEIDPSSPGYEGAQKTCGYLQPSVFSSTPPQQSHQQFVAQLKFAECMRSHGYPNFPDPTKHGVIPAGIDVNTLQFQAAVKECAHT
jgi:hypothetical protein